MKSFIHSCVVCSTPLQRALSLYIFCAHFHQQVLLWIKHRVAAVGSSPALRLTFWPAPYGPRVNLCAYRRVRAKVREMEREFMNLCLRAHVCSCAAWLHIWTRYILTLCKRRQTEAQGSASVTPCCHFKVGATHLVNTNAAPKQTLLC